MLGKIVFALLLLIIVLTPIPYGTGEVWWKALFICGVFAVCILAVIEIAISNSVELNPRSPVLALLALPALAFFQSWTRISADPFQTRFFALQLLALAAFLALLYRYAATESRVRILIYAVVGIALVSAIFGMLRHTTQHQVGFVLPLLRPHEGFAQFVNKNHFAFLMELAFGLLVGLVVAERSRHALLYLAFASPLWVALVLSNSRGGILAMLVQVVIAALLLTKQFVLRAALAAVLVIGVLAGTMWLGGDRLASNFEAVNREVNAEIASAREGASRNEIWRATLKLFAGHPLVGAGLGGYWIGITAYHDASGVLTPQEAHNDYLELLASGGVIGFALGVWFVVSVVREIRKNLWSNTGFIRAARLGAILGIAGVAVHSLVDFGLHLMGNAVVFLTLIMLATATIETRKVVDRTPVEQ